MRDYKIRVWAFAHVNIKYFSWTYNSDAQRPSEWERTIGCHWWIFDSFLLFCCNQSHRKKMKQSLRANSFCIFERTKFENSVFNHFELILIHRAGNSINCKIDGYIEKTIFRLFVSAVIFKLKLMIIANSDSISSPVEIVMQFAVTNMKWKIHTLSWKSIDFEHPKLASEFLIALSKWNKILLHTFGQPWWWQAHILIHIYCKNVCCTRRYYLFWRR